MAVINHSGTMAALLNHGGITKAGASPNLAEGVANEVDGLQSLLLPQVHRHRQLRHQVVP